MEQLSYRKLIVWQKALELLKIVYVLSGRFPKREQYVLTNQVQRASVSVVSNIAEGSARSSSAEQKRFYQIARSSLVEIDAQVEIAIALEYITESDSKPLQAIGTEVFKILCKLISRET